MVRAKVKMQIMVKEKAKLIVKVNNNTGRR